MTESSSLSFHSLLTGILRWHQTPNPLSPACYLQEQQARVEQKRRWKPEATGEMYHITLLIISNKKTKTQASSKERKAAIPHKQFPPKVEIPHPEPALFAGWQLGPKQPLANAT